MGGLYLHIPFCWRRCVYCDFYSHEGVLEYKDAFLSAAEGELLMRREYMGDGVVRSIYVGGGTPSCLSVSELERLFGVVYRLFSVSEGAEITLEVNPDDMTAEYVLGLHQLPVNRISMGVQSLLDDELRFLGRRHNRQEAVEAVERCRRNGFDNISIDLIYGLPYQTVGRWERTLRDALQLGPAHLSAYHLTWEPGTLLYRLKTEGKVQPADEGASLAHYTLLTGLLGDAGYQHYEISNFALPQRIARHNSAYWCGKSYLGIGPSAHSYDGRSRWWNVASLVQYIRGIKAGRPRGGSETLTVRDRYNEYLLTRLRTIWGVRLGHIRQEFGDEFYAYFLGQAARHIQSCAIIRRGERMVVAPSAWFVSDSIISDLLRV